MENVNILAILGNLDMTGCGFHLTADDILQLYLALLHIKTIYIDMIHTLICHQKILIIMCHAGTVDMGTEIPLCHTAQPLVVDFISDFADGTVLFQSEYCQLTVMITGYKQIPIRIIRRNIAASHTIDWCKVDQLQISVRLDGISLHTKIRYRIKKLSVVGNGQIGRVRDLYLIFLLKTAVFHIHIIYSDAMTVPLCVTGNVGNIFSLAHYLIHLIVLCIFIFYKYSTILKIVNHFFC